MTENQDLRLDVCNKLTPCGLKYLVHGIDYQLSLINLAAMLLLNKGETFILHSEVKQYLKFDDLVIDNGAMMIFVQAKHDSVDKNYSETDFFGSKNNDYYSILIS